MTESQPSTDDDYAKLDDTLAEVLTLRFSVPDVGAESSPEQVLAALAGCRGALDRVEEHLLRLTRARARVQNASAAAKADAEHRWDLAAQSGAKGAARDSGPRERYADYELQIFEQRVVQRRAEALERVVGSAVEVCRTAHRGLDGLRNDLHARLRAFAFERNLERETPG